MAIPKLVQVIDNVPIYGETEDLQKSSVEFSLGGKI